MVEKGGVVVVGAQWGDEGKGKIVDVLSAESDMVVRFNGGNNAGHTVITEDKVFKFHLLPSGVVLGKRSIIAAGVVLDPIGLLEEVKEVEKQGLKVTPSLLGIDFRTQIITPWHKLKDSAREEASGKARIDTTRKGIGPAYEDKASRVGVRFEQLINPERIERKVKELNEWNTRVIKQAYGTPSSELDAAEKEFNTYLEAGKKLREYECDGVLEINQALHSGKNVLFEAAQGTFLDNSFGTYPFVTSSHTIAGSACVGAGVSPLLIKRVEGVSKAYTTRVGNGPFPTELKDDTGEEIRKKGNEFGTTTGRPRRTGWLDLPMLRVANDLNGFTGLHITKLDVFGGSEKLKLCIGYEVNGKKTDRLPERKSEIENCTPLYEEVKGFDAFSNEGWKEVAERGKEEGLDALPQHALKYVRRIEEMVKVPVLSVSIGPERNYIIFSQKEVKLNGMQRKWERGD